jgi:hypothetical protein
MVALLVDSMVVLSADVMVDLMDVQMVDLKVDMLVVT